MGKEKLILSQSGNKFYLSVPKEILIGKINSNCDDLDDNIIISVKYLYFFKDVNIAYTDNEKNIGQEQVYGSIYLIYQWFSKLTIPKGTFELSKDVFDKLKKVLKNYDNIFEIEFRKFYSDSNDDFENYKVNIDYEMIKLENPIKNKDYLFRLKDNNIPISWVEQSSNLIKKREDLNSRYGNISCEKVNLVDFNGRIPENIDFIITQGFADRLDELFKCWNSGNMKTKKMKLVDFLYENYSNKISVNNNYYTINLNDKFSLLVDVQYLQILEVKTNYYNLKISYIDELNRNIDKIRQKIDELNS